MQVFTALYAGMSEQIKVERNKHHHPPGDRKEWDLWEMWFSSLKKKNPSKQRAEIFVWLNYLFIPLKGAMPVFLTILPN